MENKEQRQSDVVEAMRFLLIILVLFIHVLPFDRKPMVLSFSGKGIYRVVSEMVSHNLGEIAVPCFFFFSGFFFFYKTAGNWSWEFYRTQLGKKGRTLFIPYLIWNLLLILAIVAKNYVFRFVALESDVFLSMLHIHSWYDLLWSMPINFPLWYLRDLICMVLLTPFFFFFFKYTKIYGLLLLMIVYLAGWSIPVPGLGITAFLFFGGGAFLAMNKKNMVVVCSKVRKPFAWASLFLLCLATCYNGMAYHEYIVRVFVLCGIVTAVNVTDQLIRYATWKKWLCRLSATVFFIYAVHEIYIINWVKGYFYRTALLSDQWGGVLGYFLIPGITLLVCLGLYFLLRKACPRLLSVLTGGRVLYRANGKEGK